MNKMQLVPIANMDWCTCVAACIGKKALQRTQET